MTQPLLDAVRHESTYQPPLGVPCWHTPDDAAEALGVSVSTVRRAARSVGVKRIRGGVVTGMVEMSGYGSRGYMPYAE